VGGTSGGKLVTSYFDLNLNDLGTATNGNCDFMEAVAFEDTFSSLNTTRWDPSSMSGQDHCQGLAPAGPSTCTAMLPSMVMVNKTFNTINPLLSGTGLALRASQQPCSTVKGSSNPAQCCSGSTCAAWAGAHLVSQGCILYGVLELEAAFDMTKPNSAGRTSGAFYFTATYLVKSSYPTFDPSWNEIDVGMIEGSRGLEFHVTMFTANATAPTQTTMDALFIDASGPINPSSACGLGSPGNVPCPPKTSDGSSGGSNVPGSVHAAGRVNPSAMLKDSNNFHTYKVIWTPQWTAWMVDTTVYRNVTFSIWRPQSIRQILRTNVGDSADPAPATGAWCANAAGNGGSVGNMQCVNYGVDRPDAYVYIKRIRYTPLSAQAVNDAMTSVSMYAKYGPLPFTAPPSATSALKLSGTPPTVTGRRALLQSASDVATAVSTAIPGLPPSALTVSISEYEILGYLVITDTCSQTCATCSPTCAITAATWSVGMQAALLAGLASDVVPALDKLSLVSVSPLTTSMQCNLPAVSGVPACPLNGTSNDTYVNVPGIDAPTAGVVVQVRIGGYPDAATANADLLVLEDDSGSGFTSVITALNSFVDLSPAPNGPVYAPIFVGMLDAASAPMYKPQVNAIYSLSVSGDPATLNTTLTSIHNALSVGTIPGFQPAPPAVCAATASLATCTTSNNNLRAWYGVGIAFLIAFGLQTLGLVAAIVHISKASAASAAVAAAAAAPASKV